jgi:hypothetical protein
MVYEAGGGFAPWLSYMLGRFGRIRKLCLPRVVGLFELLSSTTTHSYLSLALSDKHATTNLRRLISGIYGIGYTVCVSPVVLELCQSCSQATRRYLQNYD